MASLRHYRFIGAWKLSITRDAVDGTRHAVASIMRRTAVAVAFSIGCATPVRPAELPAFESPYLIDDATYTSRIAGLRATLTRSSIALDTATIRTCKGDHGSNCVRCDIASRAETSGIDPEILDGVAIAFARYPTSVLVASKLEHVALCRRIRYVTEDQDSATGPAGLADVTARRMLISVEFFVDKRHTDDFTVEEIVHHELFHLFDYATLGDAMTTDQEWRALNPHGFEYRDPAAEVERPAGFVNSYATTNEMEDRASVFEYLMGKPSELCAIVKQDPVVAGKAAVVFRRFAKVAGDAFMAKQAPCLAPPSKAKPRAKPPDRKLRMRLPRHS